MLQLSRLFGLFLALAWVFGSTIGVARAAQKGEPIEVIARGSGLTAEAALLDAFRDAVRQAVGALVDAKTMIKNDELIEDKVLTLSNGFVKSYAKKSEIKEGGLIKVRIAAKVERGKLLEKLIEFKVTATPFDIIPGLHKAEIKKQATDLLKKALTELPRVLVAEAESAPDLDDEGQFVIQVKVKADLKRYETFTETMKTILNEVCVDRDSVVGTAVKVRPFNPRTPEEMAMRFMESEKQTRLDNRNGLLIWVWLQAPRTANATGTRWYGYAVKRVNTLPVLEEAVKGKLLVRLRLLDKDNKTIDEEEFEPLHPGTDRPLQGSISGDVRRVVRDGKVVSSWPSAHWLWGVVETDKLYGNPSEYKRTTHFLLAPGIIEPFKRVSGMGIPPFSTPQVWLVPKEVTYRRRVLLSKEDLGRVKTIECTPVFRPAN